MSRQTALALSAPVHAPREVVHRTQGRGGAPITRLMSPSDLGQYLKPFVFLDLIDAPSSIASAGNLHPHSGIATIERSVTIFRSPSPAMKGPSGMVRSPE